MRVVISLCVVRENERNHLLVLLFHVSSDTLSFQPSWQTGNSVLGSVPWTICSPFVLSISQYGEMTVEDALDSLHNHVDP